MPGLHFAHCCSSAAVMRLLLQIFFGTEKSNFFSYKEINIMILLGRNCQFLIAALIFSAGHYCTPNFLHFKEFELYWYAVSLFLRTVHFF